MVGSKKNKKKSQILTFVPTDASGSWDWLESEEWRPLKRDRRKLGGKKIIVNPKARDLEQLKTQTMTVRKYPTFIGLWWEFLSAIINRVLRCWMSRCVLYDSLKNGHWFVCFFSPPDRKMWIRKNIEYIYLRRVKLLKGRSHLSRAVTSGVCWAAEGGASAGVPASPEWHCWDSDDMEKLFFKADRAKSSIRW